MDLFEYARLDRDELLNEIGRLLENRNKVSDGIQQVIGLLDDMPCAHNHPDVLRSIDELDALI